MRITPRNKSDVNSLNVTAMKHDENQGNRRQTQPCFLHEKKKKKETHASRSERIVRSKNVRDYGPRKLQFFVRVILSRWFPLFDDRRFRCDSVSLNFRTRSSLCSIEMERLFKERSVERSGQTSKNRCVRLNCNRLVIAIQSTTKTRILRHSEHTILANTFTI